MTWTIKCYVPHNSTSSTTQFYCLTFFLTLLNLSTSKKSKDSAGKFKKTCNRLAFAFLAAIKNRKHWIIRGMFNLNVPFLPTHIKNPLFKRSFFSFCVFILWYEFSSPFLSRWSLIFCDGEPNHNFIGWWIVYLGIWRALTISDEMVNSGCQKPYTLINLDAIFGLLLKNILGLPEFFFENES